MTAMSRLLARFPPGWRAYAELVRIDKPIGTLLLLWPVLSALWLAADGLPEVRLLLVFLAGTVLTRAAGCAVNDFADRDFDGHVMRTQNRPLASGRIAPKNALIVAAVLFLIAFSLVLLTNQLTVMLAFVGLFLASFYPFTNRCSHYPQLFLGIAFSWGIPMAFCAVTASWPSLACWLLFAANLSWVVAYDTEYAMVDRDDDLRIGIKSTAIAFGRYDRLWIGLFQAAMLATLVALSFVAGLGSLYYLALAVIAGLFLHQQKLIFERKPDQCFVAFQHNNRVGLVLFCGIALDTTLA